MRMVSFFPLLLLATAIAATAAASDAAILSILKDVSGDPLGTLSTWNSSTPLCQWHGVVCSLHHRITSLSLRSLQLQPSRVAAAIQDLPHLRNLTISSSNFTQPLDGITLQSCSLQLLNISSNQMNGSFPAEFLRMCPGLKHFDASLNQMSGRLLGSYFGGGGCSNLLSLDISSNQMTGPIPVELVAGCAALRELSVAYNRFTGPFPPLNASSSNLRRLKLAGNSFTEFQIVSSGSCERLVELDVSTNNISGMIFPAAAANHGFCPRLKSLNVSVNFLSGLAAEAIGGQSLGQGFLPSLQVLDVSYNNISGKVLEIHEKLLFLNASSNSFTSVPESFCEPSFQLKSLLLPNNKLEGRLLDSITNCTSLEMLDFSFNAVSGELPATFCEEHPHIQHLVAWVNKLEGIIPSTFGGCVNLSTAILSYNSLHGTIPPEISRLRNLWWLSLSSNRLTGTIPPTLGELQTIEVLQLGNNSLHGSIPPELRNCKNLLIVDLSANQLTGTVPSRIGRDHTGELIFGLAPVVSSTLGNCNLLEVQFSKCRGRDGLFAMQGLHLEVLQQRVSELATECNWTMLNLPLFKVTVTSLIVLALSYNNLTGEIPLDLSGEENLYKLDLAHNLLTGPIPESIAELKNVQVLDLSENRLTGRIPDVLAELNFLFSLNVSYNRLSGMIPQKGQLTTFQRSSYEGNPGLFGYPLGDRVGARGPSAMEVNGEFPEDDRREELIAGVACFVVSFVVVTTGTILLTRDRQVRKVLSLRR